MAEFKKGSTIYTQMGDYLHQMVQAEHALTGNLYAAEAAVVDVQNKFVGRIDMITASGEVVEIKTVSLDELNNMQEPRHEHKLQLGYYLGAIGAKKGKILYVAREAPYRRKTFTVMANEALYHMGKQYILGRRTGTDKDFQYSLQSALEEQKHPTQMASEYFDALRGYKQNLSRLNASRQRMSIKKSISLAQQGGNKEEHNYIPGFIEGGIGKKIRQYMTGFGSSYTPSPHDVQEGIARTYKDRLKRHDPNRVISEYARQRALERQKPLTHRPFADKFSKPVPVMSAEDAFKLTQEALKESGLDKAKMNLALDIEAGISHNIKQTAPIWEASIVQFEDVPLTIEQQRAWIKEKLPEIQATDREPWTKERLKYEVRKHALSKSAARPGQYAAKTFRALHLHEDVLESIKKAESFDWLISKGVMTEKDVQATMIRAERAGFAVSDSLKFLQGEAESYARVMYGTGNDASDDLTGYRKLREMRAKGEIGETFRVGEWFSSREKMLSDLSDYTNEITKASKAEGKMVELVGHNILAFDIPQIEQQGQTLLSEADHQVKMGEDSYLKESKYDTLLNRGEIHKAEQEMYQHIEGFKKLSRTVGGEEDLTIPSRAQAKLGETLKNVGIVNEAQLGRHAHMSAPDAVNNMILRNQMVAAHSQENFENIMTNNISEETLAYSKNVKQDQYVAAKKSNPIKSENVDEVLGSVGKGDLNRFHQETPVVSYDPQYTARPAGLNKPDSFYAGVEPKVASYMDEIIGEGAYAEAKEMTRQGGQTLNKAYKTFDDWVLKTAKGMGFDPKKFNMSAGRLGLVAVGALAAGALGAMTLWDQPEFSNKPFRPPMRKFSTPSGHDDDYRDTRFDNNGLAHTQRMQLTDFGSGYKGPRGSTVGHIQSIDARPNLSNIYQHQNNELRAHHLNVNTLGGRTDLGQLTNQRIPSPRVSEVNFHSNLEFPKTPKSIDMGKLKRIASFRQRASLGTEPVFQMNQNRTQHHRM